MTGAVEVDAERERGDEPSAVASRTAWERVKLARHPARPHTLDYLHELVTISSSCTGTGPSATTAP